MMAPEQCSEYHLFSLVRIARTSKLRVLKVEIYFIFPNGTYCVGSPILDYLAKASTSIILKLLTNQGLMTTSGHFVT